MRAKILVSILFGLLLPWAYFFLLETTPMNLYQNGVLISEAAPKNELILFIEFYGLVGALVLYLKSFLVCALCVFVICSTHSLIAKKLNDNL